MPNEKKPLKPDGYDVIIIVRHGKPALSRKLQLNWREYREWWAKYDVGGLAEKQKIPKKLTKLAALADVVISSSLPRAVESAERVAGRKPDKIWPELVEAALPSPPARPAQAAP